MTQLNRSDSVTGTLKYLEHTDGQRSYNVGVNEKRETEHLGDFINIDVPVVNARSIDETFTLDTQGFTLIKQTSTVSDFYNDADLQKVYNDEVEETIIGLTGASHVEVFDHTQRSSSSAVREQRAIREPAAVIHNDYSAQSALTRLDGHFADRADELESLKNRRFAIINVWRSINGPVMQSPLALCDARTSDYKDLVAVKRVAKDRVGELQLALHSESHSWYYYPEMAIDEVLLIKTYDSLDDGRARFTLHTSFQPHDADGNLPERESLETRCFVFFK